MICIPFVKLVEKEEHSFTKHKQGAYSVCALKCFTSLHFDHVELAKTSTVCLS